MLNHNMSQCESYQNIPLIPPDLRPIGLYRGNLSAIAQSCDHFYYSLHDVAGEDLGAGLC